MKRILVIEDDDYRIRWFYSKFHNDKVTVVDTYEDATNILGSRLFDILFIDHDINCMVHEGSNVEWNGHEIAKWIKNKKLKFEQIFIHSCNGPGADNIYNELIDCSAEVNKIPYYELIQKI